MLQFEHAVAVVIALLVVLGSSFAVPGTGDGGGDPAPFGDLVNVGMTQEAVSEADRLGVEIPKAQVYYSRFEYGVGYYGVASLAARLQRPDHERRYGRPLVVHVSDFAGRDLNLTESGYLRTAGIQPPGWVRAGDAYFVVGSRARTPTGPAVVPFSDRGDADRFAERHGGTVERWAAVRERSADRPGRSPEAWRRTVANRSAWANRTVAATAPLLDRNVSVTVGKNAPTLAAAVRRAPPNTTVRLPPGTYRPRNLTVEKPLTLRGAGPETVLRGDGNGTVIEFHAPRSAVASLRVAGVGDSRAGNLSGVEEWEERIRLAYAVADAGIRFRDANGSLAADVGVRTPANGIVFIDSDGSVARGVRVVGDTPWTAGFMDLLSFRSRIVVQDSQFYGGRDAVYTHRAHGIVVRNITAERVRFAVHEMYTSRSLIRDTAAYNTSIGIVVMTRPTGNAVVGNAVRDSHVGVSLAGSRSYAADNVLFDNEYGLKTASSGSRYTGNLLADNRFGSRVGTLLPTDRVSGNDFVRNERHVADRSFGSLKVWTRDGTGNYWSGAPGLDRDGDGVIERSFRPTGPVDGPAYRAPGGPTLARAPAVALLRATEASLPGFRRAGVIDTGPLAEPTADPATRLADARRRTAELPDPLVPPVGNRTTPTRAPAPTASPTATTAPQPEVTP